jgi:hypothetical protein
MEKAAGISEQYPISMIPTEIRGEKSSEFWYLNGAYISSVC